MKLMATWFPCTPGQQVLHQTLHICIEKKCMKWMKCIHSRWSGTWTNTHTDMDVVVCFVHHA